MNEISTRNALLRLQRAEDDLKKNITEERKTRRAVVAVKNAQEYHEQRSEEMRENLQCMEAHFNGSQGYHVQMANVRNRIKTLEDKENGRNRAWWLVLAALISLLGMVGKDCVADGFSNPRGAKHVEHPEHAPAG